ncbi:6,7-dimethyl-8-ribityllumazine synthase [Candidatus Desantisbacteria bacterium CG2_30_40_21]|uniref:6,7-dimethyl-8-ribityllumazine synthase n=3 Tax=unclassified Candidatus Desantisiibacteriota TaxID=3106372 RepID=A0A2M8ASK4_9BACT|nr:MAG: 6,7-dimethyl-8-ribityllumazine synthase [Candidatus Desantisbacteria bacterium CG2_30_40_21]PIP41434.1 MAG: 6,7-dimethyl-8-ribityllumazine synthase [Candidatus Desantisbacteria bacterium CG23_combo_of_CG06-09_8_20_14_all_40_23]PJB28703.1 MAG: 6,7-dimethyl-8-ribityllumazine synthase [Candidatus Desantisbacteria bacterium CG_4_9_14_3_um_filter_40_11]
MSVYEGQLDAKGLKFGLIVSRFNEFITSKLEDGCMDALLRHGASEDAVDIFRVPGAFEIPYLANKLAAKSPLLKGVAGLSDKPYDAIVCLGVVIRGATPHFDYICAEVSKGIAQASIATGVPIIYGILTTDTIEQSIERAGTKIGNKGFDAGISAIEMANLYQLINK